VRQICDIFDKLSNAQECTSYSFSNTGSVQPETRLALAETVCDRAAKAFAEKPWHRHPPGTAAVEAPSRLASRKGARPLRRNRGRIVESACIPAPSQAQRPDDRRVLLSAIFVPLAVAGGSLIAPAAPTPKPPH
jgi:hypothetical protein